jgi:hypothetical protein
VASRRTVRRWTGGALAGAVGLGLLLALLVYEQHRPSQALPGDDAALQALRAACDEKIRRDARTVSMTPDAAAAERPEGSVTPGMGQPAPEARKEPAPAAPVPAAPQRTLRMTDYEWAAHNAGLQHDVCTEYYRMRLARSR